MTETSAEKTPALSVLIVNWNGERFLDDCLTSLSRQTFKDFEVVFVDNASADNSLAVTRELAGRLGLSVKIIELPPPNRGFTGGNIEGLRHCAGRHIALLNNDVLVDEKWCGELIKAMDENPDVGICASLALAHDTGLVDSAGDGFSGYLKGFKRGEGEPAEKYAGQELVFGACAVAALYRREMLDETGFLDEDFFIIAEDVDLSFRAQLCGWKVLYVPTAVLRHKVSSSIGKVSDRQVYYTMRNSELVRIKNVPLYVFLRCLPSYVIGTLAEFFYFAVRHGKIGVYLRSKFDALRMLPAMLKKRREIMKKKRVGAGYILGMITPVLNRDFMRIKLKRFLHG